MQQATQHLHDEILRLRHENTDLQKVNAELRESLGEARGYKSVILWEISIDRLKSNSSIYF
jgi:hypothetical protein